MRLRPLRTTRSSPFKLSSALYEQVLLISDGRQGAPFITVAAFQSHQVSIKIYEDLDEILSAAAEELKSRHLNEFIHLISSKIHFVQTSNESIVNNQRPNLLFA